MHCEITTCGHCGRDMSGDRWKLTMYRQNKPYSWRTIGWNRYYCRDCAAQIMAEIEREDADG